MSSNVFKYFSIFIIITISMSVITAQMVPVPDIEEDPDANSNPFKIPRNKKFVEPLVVELNRATLEELTHNFPQTVILFKNTENVEILKDFERLSKNLRKNYHVIFGVYNLSTEDQNIIKNYKIKELPSLFFVEKLKVYEYTGNLSNLTEIKSFLVDFLSKELIVLKTTDDFHKFQSKPNKSKLLAVYRNNMVKEKRLLENMLEKDIFSDSGRFSLGWTSDQSIIPIPSDLQLPSLILYNDFKEDEEGYSVVKYQGDFMDGQEILSFCQINSLPLVPIYNDETSFRIFAGSIEVQMLLFLNKERNNTKEIEEFKKAARFNKDEELHYERIMFTLVYFDQEDVEFLEFFGIHSKEDLETPKIFLSKLDKKFQRMDKYLYEKDEIDQEFIKDFIDEFRKKELKQFYRSEKPLDNSEKWPLILVGSEFVKEVIRSKDNYVILFCSEKEEKFCLGAKKYLEKIALKIDKNNRNIVKFAYFDIDKNEVRYTNIIKKILILYKG